MASYTSEYESKTKTPGDGSAGVFVRKWYGVIQRCRRRHSAELDGYPKNLTADKMPIIAAAKPPL